MKKICVFGASGYVGASVYATLQNDEKVRALGTDLNYGVREDLIELDINDPESFSMFYKKEQPDVVIWSVMAGPDEFRLSDEGLLHLIAHLTPATKLVYLSSDYVFARGKGPYAEQDMLQMMADDNSLSNYANAKIKAEKFIQRELTNYCILRAGPIYGKNACGKSDAHTEKMEAALSEGQPVAFRDDLVRTFVHIEDFAKVVAEMAENKRRGIYHIGPARQQSFYQFMKEQAELNGYDAHLIRREERKLQLNIPKNTALLTDRIRLITRQQIR